VKIFTNFTSCEVLQITSTVKPNFGKSFCLSLG